MKKLLLFILFFSGNTIMAQNQDSLWKEIDTAYRQGNLKSIQPRVEEAIRLARSQNNVPYLSKGLFYDGMIRLTTSDETDDINPVFENFRKEMATAGGIAQAVLQLYYARLYEIYFDENRYRIVRRTALETPTSDDVRYWTQPAFHTRITQLYEQVLAQKNLLLGQASRDWESLFEIPEDTARHFDLIPTLYDAFSHYRVAYLRKSGEPVQRLLDELADQQFQRAEINAALYSRSLEIQDPAALEKLAQEYPKAWYSAELYKRAATHYLENGFSERDPAALRKVLALEEKTAASFPDSDAAKAIASLARTVREPSFSVEIEKYIPIKENTPFRVAHRNLGTVYVRVLDYNTGLKDPNFLGAARALLDQYGDSEERYAAFLKEHKTVAEYPVTLGAFDDYLEHSSLFLLRPLTQGRYVLLFSKDPTFAFSSGLKYAGIHVSDTAVEFDDAFRVTDRRSGKPLKGKKIEVYKYTFDYNTGQESATLLQTLTTDQAGRARISNERQFIYRVKGESIFYGENLYHRVLPREEQEREHSVTKIFTDRAIYRPGQTVYFKAIATSSLRRELKVLPRRDLTVTLLDVNGKEISSLSLKTNEFGSVHGEFVLPASVLTGSFSIQTSLNGYHHFQVEEYKRPRFHVALNMPSGAYGLGDTVQVSGRAEAFSGASLDHAAVEYRVYRQAIYPFRYRGLPPFEPEQQVAFGTVETDRDGAFSLRFQAIPARERKDSTDVRTYAYRLEAAVTDLNGETQTGTGTVRVGDKRVVLSVRIEETADVSALDTLQIRAVNLNEQPVEAAGTLQIYPLKAPGRILRKSLYTTDYSYYSKAKFAELFPNEPYLEEANPEKWERGAPIFSETFDTRNRTTLSVKDAHQLAEGYYLLLLRGEVETEQVVYLKNKKKPSRPRDVFTYALDKRQFAPGETARLSLETGADHLYVYLRAESDGKLLWEKGVQLKGKPQTIDLPVKENYRGGVWMHYAFVRFNQEEKGSIRIDVPFEQLQVTTAVTRDKLLPGATEQWSFTVSGNGKDRVLAEMLTGMYDASLDQFAAHSFAYTAYNFYNGAQHAFGYRSYAFLPASVREILPRGPAPYYGQNYNVLPLNTFDFSFRSHSLQQVQYKSMRAGGIERAEMAAAAPAEEADAVVAQNLDESPKEKPVPVRKALQETAFFFPDLKTDKEGNVRFEFTVPESLTEWKLMAFAHTTDMKTGYYESRVKTSKDLMVIPNAPRFLRAGDEVRISTKIVNLSDGALNGTARLLLFDALSNAPVDPAFGNTPAERAFTAAAGQSGEVSWTLRVPADIAAVVYRVVASAGDFSDGEESILPVVSNRMLVTETLPLYIRENQEKTFSLEKLVKSTSADHFRLTFEMTTNPIWYAIFALPYLREYPYDCSEQVFSKLYGNLLSEKIITSQPKIMAVFDDWNRKGQLQSRLEVNAELKNILLEETPWVRDAASEEEQMKRIAVLFDLNKMRHDVRVTFDKLSAQQMPSGGFPWFDGGRENEYITTHIVAGLGNLKNMGIDYPKFGLNVENLLTEAIRFLDQRQLEYYNDQKKRKESNLDHLTGLHYLYARSFFLEAHPLPAGLDSLRQIYLSNTRKEKLKMPLQSQALAALVLSRFGEKEEAQKLLHSVKDHAVNSDEMGMYWKENRTGWSWYQAPVETQALLIEAFDEVLNDTASIESMKVWLLKNRQTNRWNSTKATTKAVYALLNTGKSWADAGKGVQVRVAAEELDLNVPSARSGSGYVKMAWDKSEIQPEMGRVTVKKTSPGVAWGALYWQYFEDLDKITAAETGIMFRKRLYLKTNSENGPVLREITAQTPVEVGNLVTVRLEISTDRAMEFVHIKDMRASGFEPVNGLSGYRWKDGLGYYESTRDLATHFFADFMPKGTYVFEYDLRAGNAGNFSNGITQMQNMYAPELSAHSEGIRVEIR